MTTPLSVLAALASRADRVMAARGLALVPVSMIPHVSQDDRRTVIRDLERRAGRFAVHTKASNVERTLQALGLDLNGR